MSIDDTNINVMNNDGLTAFHYACKEGHFEIVKLLMSRDDLHISKHDESRGTYTAFYYACAGGKFQQEEIIWLGTQICKREELHPSELFLCAKDEEVTSEEALWRKELELQICTDNSLSNRKSARK